MASKISPAQAARNHRIPPWRARVVWNGKQHLLGYFWTKEEAEAKEREFRKSRGVGDGSIKAMAHHRSKKANETMRLLMAYRNEKIDQRDREAI